MIKHYLKTDLELEFARLDYDWLHFHLIGIRSKEDQSDAFDDLFILVVNNNLYYFSGTTNPGVYWLQNFFNPCFGGTAVLVPGQYSASWKLGLHHGEPAFVQVKPVKIYRDTDKDNKSEKGVVSEIGSSINIHRANSSAISLVVGKWSAGCQVFNNYKNLDFVISEFNRLAQNSLTYTLLEEF